MYAPKPYKIVKLTIKVGQEKECPLSTFRETELQIDTEL